jgi:hypothetical protein
LWLSFQFGIACFLLRDRHKTGTNRKNRYEPKCLHLADYGPSRQAEIGQKQPVRCAYETRTDSEVALLAIQYYDRKASEACTIVAGQELERFA